MTTSNTLRIEPMANGLSLNLDESGQGKPVLILHGGAGPVSVANFSATMAQGRHAITPTHPGFAGTAQPEWLDSVEKLAAVYLELLEQRNLQDVLIIGFSVGGWIAASMAAQNSKRLAGLVVVNAVGIKVEGHIVADVFSMTPAELSAHAFHDPEKFRVDPSRLPPGHAAMMAANMKALAIYGGKMQDAQLRARLAAVTVPALVVWGESDRIAPAAYGRAFAESFAHGRFAPVAECGHMPQMEQPAALLKLVQEFADELP
jgi:pimeloyl-ACP methyl ester carboxylesterase